MVVTGGVAYAEPDDEPAADETSVQEKVIITGMRGKSRSVMDSPVPVDVLSSDEISDVPFTDANDIIKTLVPSYSLARQPISDGGTFIRPATLRGMPTDKTLVLVNSKRRHRAALVQIGGSGTQGPDIATIPAIALKSVEVLRDGAAAQYGSDAIAGVINFILKDSPEGGAFSADFGQYYEGDGFNTTLAGNFGLGLGDNGFVNVSAEYSKADATQRGEQYCESWVCVDVNSPDFNPGNTSIDGYDLDSFIAGLDSADYSGSGVVQPWGQPNAKAFRSFVNAGYTIGDVELYGFGNYSNSEADGGFFYRYPGNGTIENIRLEDGSLWSSLNLFPGGFTPRFFGNVIDYSGVVGARGEWDNGISYDFSGRLGHNEIKYTLKNTVNPSLGDMSPISFHPGDLINEEMQLQADFSKEFETGLASPLLFAFGASYMDESYELVGGNFESYTDGPYALPDPYGFCAAGVPTAAGAAVIANGSTLDCADDDDPVYQALGVGSNGFPGYSPEFSGEYTRDSYAIYGDLSADVTDALFLQGALRFEDYSDFDSELVWKVAGRYEFAPNFAVRGSVGTGFRAPTPGQQGTTNVSTRLPNGFPVATGLFPAGGPVAGALGAEPLKPEKSTNYTLGFTSSYDAFSLTVDFYQIDLEDRVYAISTLDVSTDASGDADAYQNYLNLLNAGVVGAESIGGVFYFTNAFDTSTKGVDVVGTYSKDWANGSSTKFTASVNYNETEFDSDVGSLLNDEDQYDFINYDPKVRGVFSVSHQTGPFGFLARANYYGESTNSDGSNAPLRYQDYGAKVQVDLEGSFQASEAVKISIGARNAFDQYPDKAELGDSCCGRIYRSGDVIDWQGGYYYVKLMANF
ncbi:outer membrane receptor (OMR) family protein [Hyphomonas adhaerens MHS-3]|uniref:Outer membrane receptor (OMR) family protein n=1 Tax=Hyphomonas adhaerens MHS-3 TaxID=1280949 RepID=A0A069E065_9PROT|nr:outer membrane receptor (OMR) family protein [Hyphomonas adhaerens MHS-3]